MGLRFVLAGLVGLSGAIMIGLAYHNRLGKGWQDIAGPVAK